MSCSASLKTNSSYIILDQLHNYFKKHEVLCKADCVQELGIEYYELFFICLWNVPEKCAWYILLANLLSNECFFM